jgi:hypothetical protein
MRKIYLVFAFAIAFATTAMAQNYNVYFAVDVSALAAVDSTGIHMAGNFAGASGGTASLPDWDPASGALEDADGNGVWQILVSLPAGDYEFKFINGNGWGDNEGQSGTALDATCSNTDPNGNINRTITISGDTVVGPFIYDACTISAMILNATNVSTAATMILAPNPMVDHAAILLSNPNNEVFNMTMTNMMGQVVRTENNINTNVINIEKADLVAGVYFVTLQNEAGAKITKKLIIQ